MRHRFLVLVEKGPNSYGAYAPDVPGCGVAGESPEEVLNLIKEALHIHLESMAQDGDAIPDAAHIEARFVDVELLTEVTPKAS